MMKAMDERPSEIQRQDGRTLWMHDFGLHYAGAENLNIHDVRPLFQDAFLRAWRGLGAGVASGTRPAPAPHGAMCAKANDSKGGAPRGR